MKIGIDILGGDFAPDANISGAILAKKELPNDVRLVLIGDRDQISSGLLSYGEDVSGYDIVHAPDVIYWQQKKLMLLQVQEIQVQC